MAGLYRGDRGREAATAQDYAPVMTSSDPAPGRARLIWRLLLAFAPTLLIFGSLAVGLLTSATWLALVMLVASLVISSVRNRARRKQLLDANGVVDLWFYNHRTGAVEQGHENLSPYWDGPYATREEALRSPEITRARAEKWNAED
jgi:Flp pilus assembly protein TadB